MTGIDWIIVVVYLAGLIAFSLYLSRDQNDHEDYYLGGRTMAWWAVGLSTMATQLSAISFISAPAFVGYRENGGLKWLTYEFAVPLAMLLLIAVVIPPLYRSGVVSIYGYLERRFGPSTRLLLSLVFQFSRAFATGITVYTVALVLVPMLELDLWACILIAGVAALVYDFFGGMKAVVYSDVLQMGILFLGIIACIAIGLDLLGGWGVFLDQVDPTRFDAVDFSSLGIGDSEEFGFWPMLIGGLFLYASYYGCDQSQAQRTLSASSLDEARRALLFNGLARFPLVLLYSIMGLIVGTYAFAQPGFQALIPADRPDLLMPTFILTALPAGLVGLLVASILAAAMSSLDSALNSLSAASVEDLVMRGREERLPPAEQLRYSKGFTVFWGVVCIVLAFAAGNIAPTVIEAINKVGSMFYGPILATFVLAILTRRTTTLGINVGIAAGVGLNLLLWLFAEDVLFWFWWNATGFIATVAVAALVSRIDASAASRVEVALEAIEWPRRQAILLVAYFMAIVGLSMSLAFVV